MRERDRTERKEGFLRRLPETWTWDERRRLLPRLVPVTPDELDDARPEARWRIVDLLERALAAERRRGRSGHWSYGLARHLGLIEALAAERAALGPETPANERRRGS